MVEHASTVSDSEIATLVTIRRRAAEIERIAVDLLDLVSGKSWFIGSEVETYLDVIADNAHDMRSDVRAIAFSHGLADLPT